MKVIFRTFINFRKSKKNQIINDIKLNHPKSSNTPGIKATTSEYINQPPPIPREISQVIKNPHLPSHYNKLQQEEFTKEVMAPSYISKEKTLHSSHDSSRTTFNQIQIFTTKSF